jgi:L-prolyl-PCP dehydrogenase
MIELFDAAEEIVQEQASFARALDDVTSWHGYVESGLLGVAMPASFGGQGQPFSALVATLEGLAYGGGDAGVLFAMAAQILSVQYPILRFGTEEQKSELLPRMIRGELRAAHAATEPDSGSDIFGLSATASRCPGGYRLTGTKRYITSAPVADLALVFAATDPERRLWGLSAFLVNLDAPGVERGASVQKMGLEGAQFGDVRLADCFVETKDRLGEEGIGATVFSSSLDLERAFIMAPAVGLMRRELERAVAHANSRQQGGRPIGAYQSVSNRIADMASRLQVSRLLLYHAAELKDAGRSTKLHAPLTKLAVSESYVASCLDAVRNRGAAGYLYADPSAVNLRAAIGSLLYSGTSDVLRNLIAGQVGIDDV